jgi:hypothetical protein
MPGGYTIPGGWRSPWRGWPPRARGASPHRLGRGAGRIAAAFREAAARHGPEAVWPYHSGGTLGVLSRWGIDRLRHVMGYSRQKSTICVTPAESGWKT